MRVGNGLEKTLSLLSPASLIVTNIIRGPGSGEAGNINQGSSQLDSSDRSIKIKNY
jgi:hypothetical protein